MFGVTGVGLGTLKYFTNGRKNPRHAMDLWDKVCSPRFDPAGEVESIWLTLEQQSM